MEAKLANASSLEHQARLEAHSLKSTLHRVKRSELLHHTSLQNMRASTQYPVLVLPEGRGTRYRYQSARGGERDETVWSESLRHAAHTTRAGRVRRRGVQG
jgi:hypothetical protein